MSKFKKPKRNFRKKVENDDSDNDNEIVDKNNKSVYNVKSESQAISDFKKLKVNKELNRNVKSNRTQLSFADHDEEEDELFTVKKPSHSKKVVKELKKLSQQETEDVKPVRNVTAIGSKEKSKDKVRFSSVTLNDKGDDEHSSKKDNISISSVIKAGEIPDANIIHLIRKKRQRARELGEFIPLDDTVKVENNKSRLIREDDNDMSDDDESGRLDVTINTAAVERQKQRDVFLRVEQGSDQEDSDKEREWEEQQIRKGVGSHQVCSIADAFKDCNTNQFDETSYSSIYTPTPIVRPSFPAPIPYGVSVDLASISLESMKKTLKDRLESMKSVRDSHLRERDHLDTDNKTVSEEVTTGQSQISSLEDRFHFFQEMRGYVRDIIDCLQEKVPVINKLETRMNNMLKNRSNKLITRRQQDIKDHCQEYSSRGKIGVEVRDAGHMLRMADREARRARRRRVREKKNLTGHHEGLSSDDEETPSEMSKHNTDTDLIMAEIDGVFSDAIEDYYELSEIRERFSQWRQKYGSTYSDAYIGLCIPKLVAPLIRLQLISWNPLSRQSQDLEEQSWMRDLLLGHPGELQGVVNDDDVKVIPKIVEKFILSRLTDIVNYVWDPLSTTQSCRLVNLTQKIATDYPTVNSDSKFTQGYFKAVVGRIRKSLEDDVFMPLYPKSVIENKNDEASLFFNRQFWTCVKLLGNILSWHGLIEDTLLQQVAFDSLLNRYIVLGLQSSGLNDDLIKRCQMIVSTFPKLWFSDLTTSKTLPQLENLCRYLKMSAAFLGKQTPNDSDIQRKLSRERVKQIIKLLLTMNGKDHAKELCETFSIKV